MNAQSHKVFSRDNRKATLTRIGSRKWIVARGYADETQLSHDRQECSTRRLAVAFVTDWLMKR